MKKLVLLTLAAFAGISLFGSARIDVTTQNKIKLSPTDKKTVLKVSNPAWDKKNKAFSVTSNGPKLAAGKWTKVDMAFTAESDGKVWISFCGDYASKEADMEFFRYSNIKINGQLIPNGDLTKAWFNKKENRMFPNNFWLGKKAIYVAKGGPDGKAGAFEVNHNNRAGYMFTVKAGETYVVEAMVQPVGKIPAAPVKK